MKKMMKNSFARYFVYFLAIFYLFAPFVFSVTSQNTTMTWVVPNNRSFTLTYGGSCSATAFFFVEYIAQDDADIDGNGTRILPAVSRSGTDSNCQSPSVAGMTVTNNGNVSFDVNAAFTSNLDTNLWLKVWQGNGAGCGTGGFGGWALNCYLTRTQNYVLDINEGTCRDWNSATDLISQTLATSLAVGDSNQLCFSGDFLSGAGDAIDADVAIGDHNGTYQVISEGS